MVAANPVVVTMILLKYSRKTKNVSSVTKKVIWSHTVTITKKNNNNKSTTSNIKKLAKEIKKKEFKTINTQLQ